MNSPLRIAVCSPQSALVTGGLERLCHELRVQLERRGHQVEAVRMPLAAHSKSAVVRSVLEWRLADLTKKVRWVRRGDRNGLPVLLPATS